MRARMRIATLCLAAAIYAVGGIFMKHAQGLTDLRWSLATVLAFALGSAVQAWAMQGRDMAVTYLLVLGLEGALAAAIGFWWLGEEVTPWKVVGILLILAGAGVLRVA